MREINLNLDSFLFQLRDCQQKDNLRLLLCLCVKKNYDITNCQFSN